MAEKDELPSYLKGVDKKLIRKKEHPAVRAVRHVAHHARRAVQAVKQRTAERAAKKPAVVHAAKRAAPKQKRTLGDLWDEVTEGPFGTIVYVLLGILIALAANQALMPVLHTDTPIVAVFSGSMVPTMEKGDLVIVQGGTEIKVGDIVVFDSPVYNYPVIHRVMGITADGITTKGDHNSVQDNWVIPVDKIHGKAIMRIPYVGWVKVGVYEALGMVKE